MPGSTPDPEVVDALVEAADAWLRSRRLGDLLVPADLEAILEETAGDEEVRGAMRDAVERTAAEVEARLREEERPLTEVLGPEASDRIVRAARALEPSEETLRAYLRHEATEAVLGQILYDAIREFLRRADLLGTLVDKLPVIGPIRRKIMGSLQGEVDRLLEPQIKGFLGSFTGSAAERAVGYVLSDEHRERFADARAHVARTLLARPVKDLLPPPETGTAWREALSEGLAEELARGREGRLAEAVSRLLEAEADRRLGEVLPAVDLEAGRAVLGRALTSFLAAEATREALEELGPGS